MRIVFVRQQYSIFGGGELILDRTISALAARGGEISIVSRAWPGRPELRFIRCDPPRFPRLLRERRFANAVCGLLKGKAGALVQSHDRVPCCDIFRAGEGVHAAYLERRSRQAGRSARAVLSLHPFHRSILALERALYASPRLKAVMVNSAMVADEIVEHYGFPRERIHLVPNGIELSRFDPGARDEYRRRLRKELGTDEDRPVLLLVGSGFERKGLPAAIQAAARSNTGAELWAIGADRATGRYRRLAKRSGLGSRLRLIGPVKNPVPYYAAADLLLLPTVYDPFPSVVIEALAAGLPVVTTDSCGARTAAALIDPRLVCNAGDVEGTADAIGLALDLAARPETAPRARAIAGTYGIDAMIDRMLAIHGMVAAEIAARR